jgi:hypothetical protein
MIGASNIVTDIAAIVLNMITAMSYLVIGVTYKVHEYFVSMCIERTCTEGHCICDKYIDANLAGLLVVALVTLFMGFITYKMIKYVFRTLVAFIDVLTSTFFVSLYIGFAIYALQFTDDKKIYMIVALFATTYMLSFCKDYRPLSAILATFLAFAGTYVACGLTV